MLNKTMKALSLAAVIAVGAPLVSQMAVPVFAAECSVETATIEEILANQLPDGGWKKNYATTSGTWASTTIDNKATYTEIRKLMAEYTKTQNEVYIEAAIRGINCLLEMQYDNGGWPQIRNGKGYHACITYNDNAMVNVMILLDEIANQKGDFAVIDDNLAKSCKKAVDKGLECILKTQVVVDGKLTIWGQQHDAETLEPAGARAYELPSLCTSESAAIVKFLLTRPETPEVKAAITSAANWFKANQITGIEVVKENGDVVVKPSSTAKPIWARFYEIGTNKPIFAGRDGVLKYNLSEIEKERRTGYSWYGKWPANYVKYAVEEEEDNTTEEDSGKDDNITEENTGKDDNTTEETTGNLTLTSNLNSWGSGYICTIKVNNPSSNTVNDWTIKVLKSDFTVTGSWGCTITEEGDYLIMKPVDYNASIAPNGSVEFGLQGVGTGNANFWSSVQ